MNDHPENFDEAIRHHLTVMGQIVEDLTDYHPKAILLFGSLARYLAGDTGGACPNDIDLLFVGNNLPFDVQTKDYGVPFEIQHFYAYELVNIAKTLRYDSKPVALSKLYAKTVMKGHSKNIIAASILLGHGYNDFGIEQIEIDAHLDERDYSIHKILFGKGWWTQVTQYARERRGPIGRFADKIVQRYEFQPHL